MLYTLSCGLPGVCAPTKKPGDCDSVAGAIAGDCAGPTREPVQDDPRTAAVVLPPSPSAWRHAFPLRSLEMSSHTSARLAPRLPASQGRSLRCHRQVVTVPPDPRDL